jgi:hypothetical protein
MRLQNWLETALAQARGYAKLFGDWLERVLSDPPLDEEEARRRRDPDNMFLPPPY